MKGSVKTAKYVFAFMSKRSMQIHDQRHGFMDGDIGMSEFMDTSGVLG